MPEGASGLRCSASSLAAGFIVDCQLPEPDVREVTFSTGAVTEERLVGVDDDAMRLAYTVIGNQRITPTTRTHKWFLRARVAGLSG